MSNVFLVAKLTTPGNEKLVGAFDSEDKVVTFLKDHLKLSIVNEKALLRLDEEYVIRTMPLNGGSQQFNDAASTTIPTVPAMYIKMPSDSDYNRLYNIGVKGSAILNCDCKSFEFGGGSPCKHMIRLYENPARYTPLSLFQIFRLAPQAVARPNVMQSAP